MSVLAVVGLLCLPVVGLILGRGRAKEAAARLQAMGMPFDTGAADLAAIVLETIQLAGFVSGCALLLGTLLAWLEHRVDVPGRRVLSVLVLLPLAVPSYLLAGAVQRAVEPSGLLGGLWSDAFTGFWASALVLVIVTTPYVHLIVGAAMRRIPAAEEEAAKSLGAGRVDTFLRVVLPRLRPSLAFALLVVALYTISDFGAVSVLGCRVLTWRIYQAQAGLQTVAAVDMGFGILALVVPLIVVARLVHGRVGDDRGTANPRPITPTAPGLVGRLVAWLVPGALVLLGVVVPVAELVDWLREGLARGEELAPLSAAVADTLKLTGIGLVVTIGLALVTATASAGRPRLAPWLDGLVFLLSGLPGVLMAFGLALAALWVPPLLGFDSMREELRAAAVLVAVGYAARYLAEAHGVLKPTFLRLDPRPSEVARSLGAGRLRRAFHVTLPRAAPGMVAATLLIFVALVKELPVTLLVAPLEVRTLSYRIWERYSEAYLADAAAAGLTLLAMTVTIQLLTLRWRHDA